MLGLRDLVFIAPTPSSLHHQQGQGQTISSSDPLTTSSAALSVGLGIFPLLTATPCIPQHHHPNNNNNVHDRGGEEEEGCNNTGNYHNYWNLKMCPELQVVEFDSSSARKGVIHHHHVEQNGDNNNNNNNSSIIYGPDLRVCQGCGNRAKKDCGYKRCRTCCKGRGYDCTTHVKSTWVPTKRRMRAQNDDAAISHHHTSTSNAATTTTTKSFDTSSCHQDAGFKQSLPGQVSAAAVFKCHRVSAIGNGECEFAYLATVHISGHVFKGFLYDQGVVDGKYEVPCVSELQLLGNNCTGNKNTNTININNREFSSAIGVPTPTSAYPASAC